MDIRSYGMTGDEQYGGAVVCDDEGKPCLVLHGAMAASSAVDLRDAALVIAKSAADASVCCRFLERADITCWQILVALRRALAATGHRLELTDLPAPVRDVITRSGLGADLLEH